VKEFDKMLASMIEEREKEAKGGRRRVEREN
jgi:hypothetical protein